MLDKPPAIPQNDKNEEKEIAKALEERLVMKGFNHPETLVRIHADKTHAEKLPYAQVLLGTVPSSQFPLLEIGMRLQDGAWFSIFQTIKFDTRKIFIIQLIQMVVLLLLCGTLLYVLLKFVLRPLSEFSRNVEDFGLNPENTQALAEEGSREICLAASALNKMRSKIKDSLESRNQLLAALAHDLRTPIARIRLRAECLDNRKIARDMEKDSDTIEAITNKGLDLVKSLHSEEKPVLLDVVSFIESLAEDCQASGQKLACSVPQDPLPPVLTRPACLRICVVNLLENALKFAGSAHISFRQSGEETYLDIIDNGPGIPAADLENALKPFWQLDKARSKGGSGLGLSIAANMAKLSFARLVLLPTPGGGVTARIIFF